MRASILMRLNAADKMSAVRLFRGLATERPLSNFVRVIPTAHVATPLGFGSEASRFSPRQLPSRRIPPFGLVYGTIDLATAVCETVVRDSLDLKPTRILQTDDYNTYSAINFSTRGESDLQLLDLTAGNSLRYGVPTDVTRHSKHTSGQSFSEFVYAHMPAVDGLLDTSRFTERLCVAVYDRAIPKLVASPTATPLRKSLLSATLTAWNIGAA